MKADPAGVLSGVHYLDGDFACGEGAMAAGCRFVAGYPITPSTEVVERISRRFPMMGGTFIQMEDELASMAAAFNRKGYHPPEVVKTGECVNCNLCEMICPDFAIFSVPAPDAQVGAGREEASSPPTGMKGEAP